MATSFKQKIKVSGNLLRYGLLLFCVFLDSSFIYKADNESCKLKNNSTQHGERLVYKIYYTFAGIYVGAGEAVFTTSVESFQNKSCYHYKAEGKSYTSYDWFFKVRDKYESYVDTNTMLPLKFTRKVSEGNTKKFESVLFNHTYNQATSTNGVYKTPRCVQDVLSAIYYARNLNFPQFKINQKHDYQIFLEDKIENIYVQYLGKENIKTKYGNFETIKFKNKLVGGTIFNEGDDLIAYVTNDANRIPVYIETKLVIGKVKVYLIEATGLRNSNSMKID